MTLQRFDPFRDIMNLRNQMDALFNEIGMGLLPRTAGQTEAAATWSPAVDIYETDKEIVLKAELPDIKQEDIRVSVDNNRLSITGERKFESEVKRENYHRIERSYGTFARTFTLPPTVDQDNIRAEYKQGVLTVSLPKREVAQGRNIAIQVN
ncbi:Hsp20/alpha crystallin family protein [Chloracidobacterium thermophilum]|jgi:HSP20 family protein|uniref:Molecular chaperone (Small heat shock protein) n=1 Tax=Chloracidobacterium thermophilum (strain B) TaxID=981222 RepID=G2LE75_CHLTF|nr:Hsp20/alpha crystallin family protein [Chloracidobacterium thermophilum]AEP11295.1 Molecular chaperone (small heat shock protein) [Chloracidobacterium thermophilum B]QUV79204.1 Hsp20/alpha crystallin family protein [Chloracidobacterium thermophilum]